MGNAPTKVRRPEIFSQFLNNSSATVNTVSSSTSNEEQKEEWRDGRRVITSSSYTFPVDPGFMDANDINHYTFRVILNGKNYPMPTLKSPRRILEVGCGNGTWAKEMAAEFHKAQVHAIDMVDDQFNLMNSPKNVIWDIGNVLHGLPYADNTFDFIHMRMMIGAIPSPKLADLCKDFFNKTKRGGTCCFMDPTNVLINPGPRLEEWHKLIKELCVRSNLHHNIALTFEEAMRQAGFVDVQVKKFDYNYGGWSGSIGEINADVMMRVTLVLPVMLPDLVTPEEAVKLNQDVFAEEVNQYHSGMVYIYVWGRKP